MIGITGATGQLGTLVIEALLKHTAPDNIVALVRNPAKAAALAAMGVSVREADYTRPETLKAAFNGLTRLLLISSSEVGARTQQHRNVIEAAKDLDLELFAYTSLLRADESPMLLAQEHRATETLIREANLPSVILRNGWYTENYTQGVEGILGAGKVFGTANSGKLHTASRQDYAEAAAAVLLSDEDQRGRTYELAGDQGFTLHEFAQTLSQITGKKISYEHLSEEGFKNLLVQIGLPDGFAAILADSEKHAASGWLADSSGTLSTLIGRPTTSLRASLEAVIG